MDISSILCQNYFKVRHETILNKAGGTCTAKVTKRRKELQSFLGALNYLRKISPSTTEVGKPLRWVTWVKTVWTWNGGYQKFFDKAKALIKQYACMKFYEEAKPVYLEIDASGVGLGPGLLPIRGKTNCPQDKAPQNSILKTDASKKLSSDDKRVQLHRVELRILHGLEKFDHCCFARKINIIIDHKPLGAVFKKDSHTITMTPIHPTKDSPIQSQDTLQAQIRPIHSRLVVMTESWRQRTVKYLVWISSEYTQQHTSQNACHFKIYIKQYSQD